MGLLANSTTQKAGLLNRVAQPVSVPSLPTVNANSTQQTSFDPNAPINFSVAQPEVKPTYKLSGETTIKSAPASATTPLETLVNKIQNKDVRDVVQGLIDAPKKLLFGSEQDRATINEMEQQGMKVPFSEKFVAGGFLPTVGLSQSEIIDNKAQGLISKGTDSNRAYEIASLDTLSKTIPKTPEGMQQQKLAQEQYDKLAVIPEERSSVRTANIMHNIFAGLDIAGVIPVGATVENVTKGVLRIAGSKSESEIAKELITLGIPKEKVTNLAGVLVNVDKPEVIHDLIRGALNDGKKAGLLARTAETNAPETVAKDVITDPSRIQQVKSSIQEGENIISTGTINGRTLTEEELSAVKQSVDNAKAKIGESTVADIPKPVSPEVNAIKTETPALVKTSSVELLPKDISTAIEEKAVGAKRISPDRVAHQQLTPEEGLHSLVENQKKIAKRNSDSWVKATEGLQTMIEKYGDKVPPRGSDDFMKYSALKKYAHNPKGLQDMKDQFLAKAERVDWNAEKEKAYLSKVDDEYRKLVKADISKGYKYPPEVLNYDKSFKTAVDSRARYEKGLATSFSPDDSRIVFPNNNELGVGMKRQDGKVLTPIQIKQITEGVRDFEKYVGIDLQKLAKDDRWVYVHLNDKNPFLMKGVAGLYRPRANGVSISVGGREVFEKMVDGKKVKEFVHTTMAHELGHALDGKVKETLIPSLVTRDLADTMNPFKNGYLFRGDKYWKSKSEVTARMFEEYVAVEKGMTSVFNDEGYWSKEIYESKIKPAVEGAVDKHFADYRKSPVTEPIPEVKPVETISTIETPTPEVAIAQDVPKVETVKPDTIPTEAPKTVEVNRRTPEEIAQRREKLNKRLQAIEDERKVNVEKKGVQQFETIPKEVTSVEAKAEEYLSRVPNQYQRDVLSLPDIVERSATDVKDKINIIDEIFRTPEHVLEKIGFGKEMKAIREGYEAYIKELPKNLEKITEWSKEVPKESNERIFKYLDGESITLTKEEAKVASEIQTWFKDWAVRLKLPEDNQITRYITHIFDKELVAKEFDEDLAKIIADKIPSQVYDPFLLKRLGKQGYKQDTWQALDAYVKRATRKVNMDPALELVKDKAGSSLEFSKIEASQFNYLKEYIDRINMRPTELDNKIDNTIKSVIGYKYGTRPVTYLTKLLRQATSRGMLGLSPMSALRNLSQGANTYAKLGEKYTALGYMKLFNKGAIDELKESGVLADSFIQDRSINATKKTIEKIDKGLWLMFEGAERINRGSAYFGAKAKGLAEGMSEKEAIDYAKKIVRETQFAFSSIDTPLKMNSDIMKTMFQFQTFTVKQIEFLAGMMKNKEYAGLIRYVGGSLAFVYTVGQLFGMKPTDMLPWFRFDTPPSLKLPVELAKAGLDSPDKYGQQRDLEQKASDVAKSTIGLIPAGNQLKRTIESLLLIQKGGSFDKGGNLQYEAPQTTEGKIQALIFGKNNSESAQKYFNKSDLAQQEIDQIQPFYDKVQELKKAGKDQEAIDLYDSLGDKGKTVYKKIKSQVTAEATKQGKADILPTFQKIRKMKADGQTEEALNLYNSLNEDQQKYYQLLKKQLDQKPTGAVSDSSPVKDMVLSALGVEKASAMEVPPQKDEATQIKEASSSIVDKAENIAPMIDKNYIKALIKQESSDGTDDSNRKYDQGKYGWIVGFTKPTYANIVNKAKTMKKYRNLLDSMSGFDTPEDAMKSALVYSQFLLRDHTKEQQTGKREWQDITATQLYKLYNGGGSPKGVVSFDKKFNDLSSQNELAMSQ